MRAAYISGAGGREENQDAVGCVEAKNALIACVCDGLGGHSGGRVAAYTARDAALCAQGTPTDRAWAANRAVDLGHGEHPFMRTTIVVFELSQGIARWAHCGDTRLYRIRAGDIVQLTLDHSVPQMLVRTGEITPSQIRHHEDRSRLTRALGAENCKIEEGWAEALAGDIYLIATDGVWEPLLESDMLACLRPEPEAYVRALEDLLTARARRDSDNYTALAVFA